MVRSGSIDYLWVKVVDAVISFVGAKNITGLGYSYT